MDFLEENGLFAIEKWLLQKRLSRDFFDFEKSWDRHYFFYIINSGTYESCPAAVPWLKKPRDRHLSNYFKYLGRKNACLSRCPATFRNFPELFLNSLYPTCVLFLWKSHGTAGQET